MQNFKNYISQLSKRDLFLLVFSLLLISFVIFKFLLIDNLAEKNSKLNNKAITISQQENIIAGLNGDSVSTNNVAKSSNNLINNFLKQNSSSKSLKQIRTTSDGSQRYEFEEIEFSIFIRLLDQLEKNSVSYKSLQIKKTKKNGIVDAILTAQ